MSNPREPSLMVWLANRFRCMSVAELGHRIKHACLSRWVKRSMLAAPAAMLANPVRTSGAGFLRPAGIVAEPYLAEAQAILDGDVLLFASGRFHVDSPPQWNQSPRADMEAPPGVAPRRFRTLRKSGADIKPVWELNRHLHWVRLAQAHVLSAEPRYLRGVAQQIGSWLDQCPPLQEPNWSSSLELAIRLVNWSVVWEMQGGWDGALFKSAEGQQLRSRWLESIYRHCQFISQNLSRHSSANNHLIGELMGLYVGARTWPCWDRSGAWAVQAKAELEREAVLQHYADGVNREQAIAYQAFTCECLTIAGVYGRRTADPFSDGYWHILQRAFRFLRSVKDAGGHFPMVGDADDGAVLRLEPRQGYGRAAKLLAVGDALFGEHPLQRWSDTAKWLLGDSGSRFPARVDESLTDWRFPDGGYFLFGSNFGEAGEIKGMVDCGPLGYLGIAAHGHADALAIVLSIAGEECLVDPGTFSYWSDYQWRDYFRGTAAHNTVRVDGMDQSVGGGRFMWTRKAQVSVERAPSSPASFDFAGSHDGYRRLRDPVRHTRKVAYDDAAKCLLVKDDILGKSIHTVEQFWHFAPNIQVRLIGDGVVARGRRFELRMKFSRNDLDLELIRGSEDPPLGWFSRSYGSKEPATVLRVRTTSSAVSIEARLAIKVF
jgi:hypothetical protein